MKADEIYENMTTRIIKALESADGLTWRAPWHGGFAMPRNAVTKNYYRGGNVLVLWNADYDNGWWATYRQWAAKGAQVRKHEHATHCVKWVEPKEKEGAPKRDDNGRRRIIPVGFAVFNSAQVDGWEDPTLGDAPTRVMECDDFFDKVGATIKRGKPSYSPSEDVIRMPLARAFRSTEGYYATMAHEHVHWTGHKSRLDREQQTANVSKYAEEELIAELGAAFLGAVLGVATEPRDDHVAYIQSWLTALHNDNAYVFRAASAAQRAVDLLVAAGGLDLDETEDDDQ